MLLRLLAGSRSRTTIIPGPTPCSTGSRPDITTALLVNIRHHWSRSMDPHSSLRPSCRPLTVTNPFFHLGFCLPRRRRADWRGLWGLAVLGRLHRPYRPAAARGRIGDTRAAARATARTARRPTGSDPPQRCTSASAACTAATCPGVARCTTRRHTLRHTCAGTPASGRFCVTGCSAVNGSRDPTNCSDTSGLTLERSGLSVRSVPSASCAPTTSANTSKRTRTARRHPGRRRPTPPTTTTAT